MNEIEKQETMETFKELPLTQREKELLLLGLQAGLRAGNQSNNTDQTERTA